MPYYSVAIDERLNKVSQCAQMDIIICFCDDSLATCYLTSIFSPKCDAETLLKCFTKALENLNLNLSNIIQLSTDGPNVNIKLHIIFRKYLLGDHNLTQTNSLDVGTCPLHVIHGSLKTAHKKVNWNVNEYLRRSYFLFKDFPSRRSDYVLYGGSSLIIIFIKQFYYRMDLPYSSAKFCAICWIIKNYLPPSKNISNHFYDRLYTFICPDWDVSKGYGSDR